MNRVATFSASSLEELEGKLQYWIEDSSIQPISISHTVVPISSKLAAYTAVVIYKLNI